MWAAATSNAGSDNNRDARRGAAASPLNLRGLGGTLDAVQSGKGWNPMMRGHDWLALLGAAALCVAAVSAPAQEGSQFATTHDDIAPGVDHGNSGEHLSVEFQRTPVFYRSQQPPGTIIIDTSERHLYLIQSETRGRCATASASAATASPGRAC